MLRRFMAFAAVLLIASCGGAKLPDTLDDDALTVNLSAPTAAFSGVAQARTGAAIVVDTNSGKILYSDKAESLRYPASLTKMMTLFILFEEIEAGRVSLNSQLFVTNEAASRPPSKIGIRAGGTLRVEDAVRALAVKSANDVAYAIAENIEGTEAAFARRMTSTARTLGMNKTHFVNASGLPDREQITTARDMAILARNMKKRHPRLSRYFALRDFTYGGRTYRSTNRLLGKVPGVDGMKTGYIRDAGFNLVATAKRGRKSIVVVVIGGSSGSARNKRVTELIEEYL